MRKILFNIPHHIDTELKDITELKSQTKTAFINQSILRNIRYFNAKERQRYVEMYNSAHTYDEPLEFYISTYS